jgi:hypothetical protein
MLTHYTCGSCHQHLLTWDDATKSVEMFHKIGIWQDFGTREARLICEYCLGSTGIVPDDLVEILRTRHGVAALTPEKRRPQLPP